MSFRTYWEHSTPTTGLYVTNKIEIDQVIRFNLFRRFLRDVFTEVVITRFLVGQWGHRFLRGLPISVKVRVYSENDHVRSWGERVSLRKRREGRDKEDRCKFSMYPLFQRYFVQSVGVDERGKNEHQDKDRTENHFIWCIKENVRSNVSVKTHDICFTSPFVS